MRLRWYLIPVDLKKRPLTPNGEKDASNDLEMVKVWRERWPECNLAIATGPSKLIAVDMDKYKEVYRDPAGTLGLIPSVMWKTARGGEVVVYNRPESVTIPSKISLLPAVDIKASTGYVLIPPSKNAQGQAYEWVNHPSKTAVADAPKILIDFILSHKKPLSKLPMSEEADEVYLSAGDGRWEHLRRLGGLMRRMGCGYETLCDALKAFVELQCEYDDTLRDSEVERLARWLSTVPYGESLNDEGQRDE